LRQLFTNDPSNKTEQEPHSPSPQPSFVPVNPSSCRNTSSRRSIAYALTVANRPLTVKAISHLAICEDSLIAVLRPRRARSPAPRAWQAHRKYPPEVTVSNRKQCAARLR